jgi:hypothetical protein
MAGAAEGGRLRLAILIGSLAGLVALGVKTGGGTQGASASRRAEARDHTPGKVVALAARRKLPASVRREFGGPRAPWVATIRASRSTYLMGGTRTGPKGTRVPVASVLRRTGHAAPIRVAKLPFAVTDAAGAAVGDRLYVLGGQLANGKPTDLVQEYDVATERSVVAGRLPERVSDGSALTLDGFVYLVGGVVHGTPTRAIDRFDPWRGRAALAGHLPVAARGGVAIATRRQRGYLVGAKVPRAPGVNFEIRLRPR